MLLHLFPKEIQLTVYQYKTIYFNIFIIKFHFFLGCNEKCCTFALANGGTVAQLVEQWTENPCVTGSIPVGTTS